MVQSMNQNAEQAFDRASIQPVGLVTVHLPPKRFLHVTDYTAVPAGAVIEIRLNITDYTLTEGVDWNASTSNDATAQSIRDAINNIAYGAFPRARARVEDNPLSDRALVIVAGNPTVSTLTFLQLPSAGVEELLQAADTEAKFLLADQHWPAGYPLSVAQMSGVEHTLDPMTREFGMGDMDIDFADDGEIRELLKDFHLKGRKVDIKIGTPPPAGVFENDFHPLGSWYVEDILPSSDGNFRLQLYDSMGFFRDKLIADTWAGEHPKDILVDALQTAAGTAGLSGLVDTASLDPDQEPGTAHHTVSRYDSPEGTGRPMEEPVPVLDIVNSLMLLLGGTLSPDENNLYRYRAYDQDAAADDTWQAGPETGYDVEDLEIISTWENISNEVAVDFAERDSANRVRFAEVDEEARNAVGRLYTHVLSTEWCNGVLKLYPANHVGGSDDRIVESGTTDVLLRGAAREGFAGSRFRGSPSTGYTMDGNGDLDGGATPPRRAFFRFSGWARETVGSAPIERGPPEIIAFDGATVVGSVNEDKGRADVPTSLLYQVATTYTDSVLGFTNGRAGFGTSTPQQWNVPEGPPGNNDPVRRATVVDITIPVEMVLARLPRFAYGAPVIRVRTPGIAKLKYEVGDTIEIDGDHVFATLGKDGLDQNTKWEVTRKFVDAWSDTPAIEWELTWKKDDVIPTQVTELAHPTATLETVVLEAEPGDNYLIFDDGEFVVDDNLEFMTHD